MWTVLEQKVRRRRQTLQGFVDRRTEAPTSPCSLCVLAFMVSSIGPLAASCPKTVCPIAPPGMTGRHTYRSDSQCETGERN